MSEKRMRDEFEAWAASERYAMNCMISGHYIYAVTSAAWNAWKASRAAAPAAQGEPAIRKLGIMGAAFDPPSVRRAYTYSDQPNNTTAWKLGRAACKERSGGDFIDYGLQMLQYLQEEGFGVFEIDEADPAPQPAEQKPDVTLLLELLSHARCNTCDGSGGFYDNHGQPHQCQWCHERSEALVAYRKQGGDACPRGK